MYPTEMFSGVTFCTVHFILRMTCYLIGAYFITPYLEEQKKKPQLTELYISLSYY